MTRTPPRELERAFVLFDLATEVDRERFRALEALGAEVPDAPLVARLDDSTDQRPGTGDRDAELARATRRG